MKAFRVMTWTAVLLTIALTVVPSRLHAESTNQPKGIILMIGDGMGINQIRSAAIYAREVLGKTLVMDSILTRGTTTTYSADSEVTDSAAASTALCSGYKVKNAVLNILPDGRKLFSIGHAAKTAGLSVGVLSTTRLTHATPAAVYSRTDDRDKENLIADQLLEFGPHVAMAGGLRHFIPRDQKDSKREDNRNLVEEMKKQGYSYVWDRDRLNEIDPASTDKLLGLFAMSHMAYEIDRVNCPELEKEPTLADMTRVALSVVGRNQKGFFVMVEGGRIDHACHSHDIKASIYDTLAFDDAVRVALEYRQAHPDVLVLVTADHETGGLGMGKGIEYALHLKALEPIKRSTEYLHWSILKNPAMTGDILRTGGFDLTDAERAFLTSNPSNAKLSSLPEFAGYGEKVDEYLMSWIHYALSTIESDRSHVGWTSIVHTAQPVITLAVGPGDDEFRGSYDNTDIAKKMAKLLGLIPEAPVSGTSR